MQSRNAVCRRFKKNRRFKSGGIRKVGRLRRKERRDREGEARLGADRTLEGCVEVEGRVIARREAMLILSEEVVELLRLKLGVREEGDAEVRVRRRRMGD